MRQTTKLTLVVILVFTLTILSFFKNSPDEKYKGIGFFAGELTEEQFASVKSGEPIKRLENKKNRVAAYQQKLVEYSTLAERSDLLLFDDFDFDPLKAGKSSYALNRKFAELSTKNIARLESLSAMDYRIVQFKDAVGAGTTESLKNAGFEVVGYVPNNAYVVAFNKGEKQKLSKISKTRAIIEYPKRAVLDSRLLKAMKNDELDDSIYLQVMAFSGEKMDGWEELLLDLGVNNIIYKRLEAQPLLMLEVDTNTLPTILEALLSLKGVANIRQYEVPVMLNYGSVWLLQSGDTDLQSTPLFDAGLTGHGQIYAAVDSGLDTDACHFRYSADAESQTFSQRKSPPSVEITNPDSKVIAYYVFAGSDDYDDSAGGYHGTMTTGCAVGDDYKNLSGKDDAGLDKSDGMAPAAKVVFQDAGSEQGYLYGLAMESQYNISRQAYNSGARIHNDSYGLENTSTAYDQDSAMLDRFCWENNDYTIFFAAGNSGPSEMTLGGEGSTAKNTICVGASMPAWYENGIDLISFSSRGPASDGRLKPDIVAPGLVESATESSGRAIPGSTNAHGGQTMVSKTDPPNNQCVVSITAGTSFASPTAAGMGLLVRQYFVDGYYPGGLRNDEDGFNPTSALVRAIVVNSGRPLEGDVVGFNYSGKVVSIGEIDPIPSTHQGWGRITLDDALYFRGDSRDLIVFADIDANDEGVLETGDEVEYETYVKSGKKLKVTLSWIDPEGTVGTGKTLVNDLDLEVTAPNGDVYYGNIGYVDNGSTPATAEDIPDRLNNLEQVIVKAPVNGNYKIKVVAANVPGNGATYPANSYQQGYALVATGDLGEGADVIFPRLAAKLSEINGGCDNDDSLDTNEVVTVSFELFNSGEGDSGNLFATVTPVAEETDIDTSYITIPHDGVFELDPIRAKSKTSFQVQVGLGDYPEELCEKEATFKVTIKDADDEVIEETVFRVILGVDYSNDGAMLCQEKTCNPPLNITDVVPDRIRVGAYGFNLSFDGEYFRDGMQMRFEPDILTYDEVYRRSPTEVLLKNVRVSEDAEPGSVEVFANNPESPERNFVGLLTVYEKPAEDGDAEMETETDGDAETDDEIYDGSGSGCASAGGQPPIFILALITALYLRSRKTCAKKNY